MLLLEDAIQRIAHDMRAVISGDDDRNLYRFTLGHFQHKLGPRTHGRDFRVARLWRSTSSRFVSVCARAGTLNAQTLRYPISKPEVQILLRLNSRIYSPTWQLLESSRTRSVRWMDGCQSARPNTSMPWQKMDPVMESWLRLGVGRGNPPSCWRVEPKPPKGKKSSPSTL